MERQVARLQRRLDIRERQSNRISWLRLAIFCAGAGLSAALNALSGWVPLALGVVVTLVLFNAVAYRHRLVDASVARHRIWLQLTRDQLARMDLDWSGIPQPPSPGPEPPDQLEIDLDLVGERSLHRLVTTAASEEGSARVRQWLSTPRPDSGLIRQRQLTVQELAPLTGFRTGLLAASILAGTDVARGWEGAHLVAWLQRHPAARTGHWPVFVALALSPLNVALFVLSRFAGFPNVWTISLLAYIAMYLLKRREVDALLGDAQHVKNALTRLSAVLRYLEGCRYGPHERLRALCAPLLQSQEARPSTQTRQVARIAGAAVWRNNPLVWLIVNAIVPLDLYLAYRLDGIKAALATHLPLWLDAWAEVEALSSLANLAYLNPEYVFPVVSGPSNDVPTAVFEARAVGHPLIRDDVRVTNDLAIDRLGEVILITGSNMSGKSTFLRTLGVNLRLAYAGGPVCAEALTTGAFRLGTSIRVGDSLADGVSYFYAEVKRLKALLTELEQPNPRPLFFLIDEIFRGTNNRERLIGGRSYLRALVGRNGLGAVSTHDLELIHLADELPQLRNMHFREEVLDGRLIFDYRLRPGPSPTTNALRIMQMEGLPVDLPGSEARGSA